MNTRVGTLNTEKTSRTLMAIAAISALALSLLAITGPARAATSVQLGSQFIGAQSATFQEEAADCGAFGTTGGGVVWHFILNQLDAGTPAGQLTAQFETAADQVATGEPVGNGSTQHFFVLTPSDDTLDGATASVDDQTGEPSLVLSHVCHQTGVQPTPTPTQSPTATPTQTPPEVTATPTQTPEQTVAPTATPTGTPEQTVQAATGTPAPTNSPEGGVKAATGTPAASQPDTAIGSLTGGSSAPTLLFALLLLASLGGLTYLNIGSARKDD